MNSDSSLLNQTPLFDEHQKLGAHCVNFAGWAMPLHYGSQLQEHHAVRQKAGLFDVSHMGVIDITGQGAEGLAKFLMCGNVGALNQGQALYTCFLNTQGGIVDDLIVYKLSEFHWVCVVNAATQLTDLTWIISHAQGFEVEITRRARTGILALQGPKSAEILLQLLPVELKKRVESLKPFHFVEYEGWLIAATGYTGERGYEILLPYEACVSFWKNLIAAGALPCGLGARDTLRLEAGLPLYGTDMNQETTPWVTGLSWVVHLDAEREFVGKSALIAAKTQGISETQAWVGLVLKDKGVLRNGLTVFQADQPVGQITSGGFSPTMGCSIALARILTPGLLSLEVELRGKRLKVAVVRPQFVRKGQIVCKPWS